LRQTLLQRVHAIGRSVGQRRRFTGQRFQALLADHRGAAATLAQIKRLEVSDAARPGEKIALGAELPELVPKHDARVLKHLFGVVMAEYQRHDERINSPSFAGEEAREVLAVNVVAVRIRRVS